MSPLAMGLASAAQRMLAEVPADLPAGTTAPAGVALAVRAEALDESAAAGWRHVDADGGGTAALTVDTSHDLASVTKIVATTTALLRLVSADALALDDEVCRFLPGFTDDGKSAVTVRDLLLHRAGLWEWHPLYLAGIDADSAPGFLDRLPLRYRPGTGRHYSDLGFMLLRRIVEHAAAQPFEDAVATLVTGPLDLRSTRFTRPAGDVVATSAFGDQAEMVMVDTGHPYPVPYRSADFASWRLSPVTGEVGDGNAFHLFGGVSGHAGLFSTVPDLIAFSEALANYRDHEDLWRPEVAEEFFAQGPDDGQALGFRRYSLDLGRERVDVLGHPGFVGCAVGFVPGRGIALALASNRLLTSGIPVPNERLWQQTLETAGAAIAEQAA